jgi:hypothetical protein
MMRNGHGGLFATVATVTTVLTMPGAVGAQGGTDGADRAAANGHASSETRTIRALRITDAPPRIDGRLDDAAWAGALPVTGFVQFRPTAGAAPTGQTEARVLIDDDAVYIGMRMFDDPDSVAAQLTRRDASGSFTDWAHVLIDSYHDRRTAFRFSITPRGAKKDVLHYNDSGEDVNWDAVWDASASLTPDGWSAEFRIPLSQLRFARTEDRALVWGINFGREIARHGEWSWWSPVLPSVGGLVSQAGELHDLSAVRAPRRVEVVPYTLGRVTAAPDDPGNPFYRSRDGAASIGADLRLGIGSNLTLSATINPDFSQVEADPSVVNLSALESFFAEKRPFFTEGSNIFGFGIGTDDGSGESLFYSRRIGRTPQRSARPAGGFADAPDATTILGAAKLSGRTASGWTIGFLNAITAEEEARLAIPGEPEWSEPVEPRTNYAVLSLSRDFDGGRSTLGILGTSVKRDLSDARFEFLRSSAWSLGINGRHRFLNDTWEASGYVAGSHIRGSENAIAAVQRAPGHYYQRPDADHLEFDPTRTSLSGAIANFWVGTLGGDGHWRGGFGGHLRTPGLEVNDLGFQGEADQILSFANLRYHQFEPKGRFRNVSIGLNPSIGWTFGGDRMWTQIGTFSNYELTSFWSGGHWAARRLASTTHGALRGGPSVRRDGGWFYSLWLNTDRRKSVTGSISLNGGVEDANGTWNASISTTASFRPSPQIDLSVGPRFGRATNTWQYVGQPTTAEGDPRYIVGRLDQNTVALTARLNYTISPTLSFELYAQPFISGGEYSAFRTLGDAHASTFDARFPELAGQAIAFDSHTGRYSADADGDGAREISFTDPDFNFRQMRGNAVLRWEYRPGSTLFIVWNQARTAYLQGPSDEAFALGRDVDRLFNGDDSFPTPVTNVLLIKLSYWINP